MPVIERILNDEQVAEFERDGYMVARGLLNAAENAALLDHFMTMHAQSLENAGPLAGSYHPAPLSLSDGDVLKHYPRIMMPHRLDPVSHEAMLDARYESVLSNLFGEAPLAAQSMFYFKPPGARGQALHQDNFYLHVRPGTCMAAWLSLDDADEENGGMFAVPGSHRTAIQCPGIADPRESFTTEKVDVPAGMAPVPVNLKAGDVMFFNGSVIHGSYSNRSATRFRRAFICHYVPQSTTEMHAGYYPLHTFDGARLERGVADGGGFCGSEDWSKLSEARRRWEEKPSEYMG